MSLSALQVALQGLFPLSPIAAAVQGLIAQIQEEQRRQQVAGQRGRPGSTQAPSMDGPPLVRETEQEILARVIDKWEAIERVRARENPPPVDPPPQPSRRPAPVEPPLSARSAAVELTLNARSATVKPPLNDRSATVERTLSDRSADVQRRNAQALALILAEID